MKKYLTLSILLLFLPITSGCVTAKQKQELPPRPRREELQEVKSVEDMAERITYYEGLIQEWEAWADMVEKIIR
jgi:hypothetical protein